MQATSNILMIRPVAFGFNEQTAESNAFQQDADIDNFQQKALKEFDAFVGLLRQNGVNVIVVDDTPQPHTPDSIFPNNWVSFHHDGKVFLYPMQAENRRTERRADILQTLQQQFKIEQVIDLSSYEQQHLFLEGTGSMVLDRDNKIAYACLSPRTDEQVLDDFCQQAGYTKVLFKAVDAHGQPIYHTNVLMSIATQYAVICLDCITDDEEMEQVVNALEKSGKEIIAISFKQMEHFAGNMLEVLNQNGQSLMVMSASAWGSLDEDQQQLIAEYSIPVATPISTIETLGGGSARCMMAEVHLPQL